MAIGIGRIRKAGRKGPLGAADMDMVLVAVSDGDGGLADDDADDASLPEQQLLRHSPPRKAKANPVYVIKSLKRAGSRKDIKISKSKAKVTALIKKGKTAAITGKKMQILTKNAAHDIYIERKTSRAICKRLTEHHNLEIKELKNRHADEVAELKKQIEEARELAEEGRRKAEQSEQQRIEEKATLKAEVRSERTRRSEALTRLKDEMNEILESAHEEFANDRAGMDAILAHQKCVAQNRIDTILAMSEREVNVLRSELAQKVGDELVLVTELSEMQSKCNEVRKEKRKVVAQLTAVKTTSRRKSSRLATERESRKAAEDEATELGKKLAAMSKDVDASESIPILTHMQKRQLKKVRANAENGKPGGGMVYPQWVMATICELLTCGASPSVIGKILKATYRVFYDEVPNDIPSINFIRGGRSVLAVFNETMSAMKLAIAESWDQLCTDATTRRQIPFTALIIGLLGDDSLDQVIVSSCILTDDETADAQAEGIIKKVRLYRSVRF